VGLYTYLALPITGSIEIPGFLCGLTGGLLLVLNVRFGGWRPAGALLGFLAIVGVGVLTAPDAAALLTERADSYLFLVFSVLGAYGLLLELMLWPPRLIAKIFGVWSVVIIVGALLELYGGLRPVSDAFRYAFYSRFEGHEENIARDMILFGKARPRLFTQEPSYLASFALLSASIWLMLSEKSGRYWKYMLLIVAFLVLIKSPIPILGALVALGVLVFLDGEGIFRFLLRSSVRKNAMLLGIGIAFVVAALVIGETVFSARIDRVAQGNDVSTFKRVLAPLYVTREVLAVYPLTGIGVGGESAAVELYNRAYRALGDVFLVMESHQTRKLFNFFWQHWVYLGLGYGGLAVLSLGGFARSIGLRNSLFMALLVFVFAQFIGAFVSVRAWSYMALLLVGVWHGERMREETSIGSEDFSAQPVAAPT